VSSPHRKGPPEDRTLAQRVTRTTSFERTGESPFTERPTWHRLAGLLALAGLQLSVLAMLAEVVNLVDPGLLPSVGFVAPLAAGAGFAALLWHFRSRRRS
jgi:hypothetical protein